MIYKNAEFHNVAEIIEHDGYFSWLRVPKPVYDALETEKAQRVSRGSTGVEIRFVMNSDTVTLKMRVAMREGIFHVYRGNIQGGWEDHEINKMVNLEMNEFVIKRNEREEVLEKITNDFGHPFSPEVIRIVFDRGEFEIADILGDIRPPKKEELPQKHLITYGSSITHGSNAIDTSHTWVSLTANALKMDVKNLGMAGSCLMEPALIDYIAEEGEKGNWDMAFLELGINVLDWDVEKIRERAENAVSQVAGRNRTKPVYVISPLYNEDDYLEKGKSAIWRRELKGVVERLALPNVTYINGLDLLGNMSFISSDLVHPNIHGVQEVAKNILTYLK